MHTNIDLTSDDWKYLISFLPQGWEDKAKQLGALTRCRGFANAEILLRTLMIHLAEGCSLKETALRAELGGLCSVSDVALFKRLRASGNWLQWMAEGVMKEWTPKQPTVLFGSAFRIRLIDGSIIKEPGPTGSNWRLHYSVRLPSLKCDEAHITTQKTGESLKRFKINADDLVIADRGYANRPGIRHVVNRKANIIVRCKLKLPFENEDGSPFEYLPQLRKLSGTKMGDWQVFISSLGPQERIKGRICAIRKSKEAIETAKKKILRLASKHGHKVNEETLEAAEYIFVFTTLNHVFGPATILEFYRGRWQVELAFKRLKSIIELGHLKKMDSDSVQAWLHGKILVAFLIEALVAAADSISPWGYIFHESAG